MSLNFFLIILRRAYFQRLVTVHPYPVVPRGILPSVSHPESALSWQPPSWRRNWMLHSIFNQKLLRKELETNFSTLSSLVCVRAVQRIRQQFEIPTPRTNRVGRRSCITSPMQKTVCGTLIDQPYLYRHEMADFLYYRLRKRISERSICYICDQ